MGFAPGPGTGGSSSIAGSSDVSLSSVQDDQVLAYDSGSSKWQNQAVQVSDPISLDDLPAGSTFVVVWSSSESGWTYGGSATASRPTNRVDLTMLAFGGQAAPSFAITGDIWTRDA